MRECLLQHLEQMLLPSLGSGANQDEFRTRPDFLAATLCAMNPPSEYPSRSTLVNPRAAMNCSASVTICATLSGVLPLDCPTPLLSKTITGRDAARPFTTAGSQESIVPVKCCKRIS